jgi:hypothetical protein
VAEDVAKAGLLLDDRAGQRNGQADAPGLAHEDGLEAPAVRADGARDRIAAGGRIAVAVGRVVALVGEVVTQPLGVGGAVGLGAGELGRRALLRGPDDQAERAHVAPGLEAQHAAHAPERPRGVLAHSPSMSRRSCDPRPARWAFRLDRRSAT